jgi:cyclopropane-fatty-acyl-phospholipid synthase
MVRMSRITNITSQDLPEQQSSSLRLLAARRILTKVLKQVPVRVLLPDGVVLNSPDPMTYPDPPTIEVYRPANLLRRLAKHPNIGIGEGYMAGDWRAAPGTDLAAALLPFAQNFNTTQPAGLRWFNRLTDRRPPRSRRNTLAGAKENIHNHYDLSNEMFQEFLDESMTYSCAQFDEYRPWENQSLYEAQLRKINSVLDLAAVTAGTRLLEIGTGWGSLAIAAAQRGAMVTSITLSEEQAELARNRVTQAGFADRIEIRLQDYREVQGSYDAIVSVEMIEAVGREYWPAYFEAIDRLLAPDGTVVVQSILMPHQHRRPGHDSYGWLQKHIFPGGMIPSATSITETISANTTLHSEEMIRFGRHYAETLKRWRENYTSAWPRINQLGFDEAFHRKWEFYLAYCQAGFAGSCIDVAQFRLRRAAE